MKNREFSFYIGGIKEVLPSDNKFTLEKLNRLVRSTTYEKKVQALRSGEKKIKSTLDYITPAGTFVSRSNAALIERSGVFCLDFDHVSDLRTLKADLIQRITPTLFFDSPSGHGLKVFYCINAEAGSHSDYFKSFQNYFHVEMNLEIDKQCSDVARACFLSWDNNSFYSESAPELDKKFIESYLPKEPTIKEILIQPVDIKGSSEIKISDFEQCEVIKKNLDKSETFIQGSRNHYVGLLSAGLNRIGIDQNTATNYLLQFEQPDFKSAEIKKIVECSFKQTNLHGCNPLSTKSNANEFSKLANSANTAKSNNVIELESDSKDNQLLNMPSIPNEIFVNLPELLKSGCSVFIDNRERDVFLTGAITIISGCMFNVSGLYNGKQHFANLYAFIIAAAASGKGALVWAKELGMKIHKKLLAISETKKKIYQAEMQNYKKQLYDKKVKSEDMEIPQEPPFKLLFIPANNSSARVIQHLKEGDEKGIFCETEADSMGNVLKQDWGGYSDLIRKAFHHEPISYSRKTNKEYVELNNPCFSIALSGTPGQVENLIKSSEDGLFSRFVFYTFKSPLVWRQASEKHNGVNLTEHFDYLSSEVLRFVEFLETTKQINFKLSAEQWEKLNYFGENSLLNLSCLFSEDLASTSKRLGLILFRHCMVLTALKYFDRSEVPDTIYCADEDFETALLLVKVYEQHAVFMFNELPKSSTGADKALKKFFDLLPDKFQRKEAIELALKKLQIKERTADGYLSKLLSSNLLDNPRSGQYEKIKK